MAASHAATPGSWLFRFSSSERGGFAFTVAEKDGKVTHYRVSRDWGDKGEKVNGMYIYLVLFLRHTHSLYV